MSESGSAGTHRTGPEQDRRTRAGGNSHRPGRGAAAEAYPECCNTAPHGGRAAVVVGGSKRVAARRRGKRDGEGETAPKSTDGGASKRPPVSKAAPYSPPFAVVKEPRARILYPFGPGVPKVLRRALAGVPANRPGSSRKRVPAMRSAPPATERGTPLTQSREPWLTSRALS